MLRSRIRELAGMRRLGGRDPASGDETKRNRVRIAPSSFEQFFWRLDNECRRRILLGSAKSRAAQKENGLTEYNCSHGLHGEGASLELERG
jgi:hypothetical protein